MFEVNPKLKTEEEKKDYGRFIVEPLPEGYGNTLGHSLRRVLLSSLEGAAVNQVKIDGVSHEFSSIKGVKEDVVELILNIKGIRIRLDKEDAEISLNAKGPKEVKASDIEPQAGIEVLNPEHHLATLADKNSNLNIEFKVQKGKGYVPAEDQQAREIGVIPIDAIYSPVLRVKYQVSATRVGRLTNFDRLTLEIKTDGSILPIEALKKASEILQNYYHFIVDPSIAKEEEKVEEKPKIDTQVSIEELNLPTRVTNSLLNAQINTLEDLIQKKKSEVSKIKNLGAKSIKEIENKLAELELNFKEKEEQKDETSEKGEKTGKKRGRKKKAK